MPSYKSFMCMENNISPYWVYGVTGLPRNGDSRSHWQSRGRHDPGSGDIDSWTFEPSNAYWWWRQNDRTYVLLGPGDRFYADTRDSRGVGRVLTVSSSGNSGTATLNLWSRNSRDELRYSGYEYEFPPRAADGQHYKMWITGGSSSGEEYRVFVYDSIYGWTPTFTNPPMQRFSDKPSQGADSCQSFSDRRALGLLSTGVDNMIAQVYLEACTALPKSDVNNIANILSVVSSLKSFAGGLKIGSLRKELQSGWLQYRYVYKTTVSDINSIVKQILRLSDISGSDKITSHAALTRTADGFTVTAKCAATFKLEGLGPLYEFAQRWGLRLSSYNLWDMVPYSFIVDWFLDIGGILEYYDNYELSQKLTPDEIWFSLSSTTSSREGQYREYHRWYADSPPTLLPTYTHYDPSSATIVKRTADVLALLP